MVLMQQMTYMKRPRLLTGSKAGGKGTQADAAQQGVLTSLRWQESGGSSSGLHLAALDVYERVRGGLRTGWRTSNCEGMEAECVSRCADAHHTQSEGASADFISGPAHPSRSMKTT